MTRIFVLLLVFVPAVRGQYPPDPTQTGTIEGRVVEHHSGRPMRRVQVTLRPAAGGGGALGVTTDDSGAFSFASLRAGRYTLVARHPGYLPASTAETQNTRLPMLFPLLAGERLTGITIKMRSAGVISGAVRFTDAEPAIGVPVQLYREYFYRGRHGYSRAGQAATDDRGAYRIYGLAPGNYYLVAAYAPPDPGAGVREQQRTDATGRPVAEETFVTTYYPSSPILMEAVPSRLRYGSELQHIDIHLAKVRTVRIRGRALSGLSGKVLGGATIRLRQRAPASEVMVDTPATVRSFGGEGFEIVGVTPGSYLLVAEAQEEGKRLVGRAPVTVAGDSIDNLDLTLHPYSQLNGKVLGDADPSFDLSTLRVTLEPHADATPASSVPVAKDGAFSIPFVPGETYDVFLLDGPPDIYLKSARIGGFDVLVTGFKAEGGALPPMELVFGARGASLGGEVADGTTKVALGATVVLVPDPARGRVQHYHMTSTDEYGQFRFRGIAPGRYTVVSWWDEPPCEVYDLESLDACRRHGNSVDFAEGESKFLGIPVSRAGE